MNQNLKSVLDGESSLTGYEYDERDLLFKVTDANATPGVTQYDYDTSGNLLKITDSKGQATSYEYDLFDQRTKTVYADLKFSELSYDKNSNVTRHATPSTVGIDYVYDELNRLRQKNFPASAILNAQYEYDLGFFQNTLYF